MQRIPGNQRLTKRYEYSTLVQHYMGDGWYKVTGAAYNISLLATNVAAIVITAQVVSHCSALFALLSLLCCSASRILTDCKRMSPAWVD